MKTKFILLGVALIGAGCSAATAMDVPPRVRELADGELKTLAVTPVIVAAIEAQNARNVSMSEIQAIDKKWMATPGIADFMQALIDSPAGQEARGWRKGRPWLSEVIVMDDQGANVAIADKTSDYWQGDEAKFTEPVKDGGTVFVDRMKFDDSTQTYSVQVSEPVVKDGKVIGAVCFGIDVEQL